MTAPAVHYVPILKGRMGELRALRELALTHSEAMTPLIEIPLGTADIETEDENAVGVSANPAKFADDIVRHVAGDRRVIFDASQAPAAGDGVTASVEVLASLLERSLDVTPTVRPSDSLSDVAALRDGLDEWQHHSVCIRLAGDDLDDNDEPLAHAVDSLIHGLGREPEHIDMVIDFGALADEQAVSFAARIARLVLGELPLPERWRTLTVASGGFPPDLNSVQPEVLSELTRHDAAMWRLVRDRVRGRQPSFGDYGIGYPAQVAGAGFAPAPQLRFTFGDSWLIYKGRKRDRRGSAQFYDICQRMVIAGAVQRGLSWGDDYVYDAARGEGGGRGPGNAMMWRAIGTSHHINYVVNRLATHGGP